MKAQPTSMLVPHQSRERQAAGIDNFIWPHRGLVCPRSHSLNGSASVTGNTASVEGGGIYSDPAYVSHVYVCSTLVAISPNDSDDPPRVRHVCP